MRALVRLVLALALIWTGGFVWFMLSLPGAADPALETDGIVVLTGGPGRVARGVALIEAGQADRLLISGVGMDVRPEELAVEVDAPAALFMTRVDLDRRAADTVGNATQIASWADRHDYASLR
ncbi:MAG: YdcF family protein, partial [Pseudomonadota bacterium]